MNKFEITFSYSEHFSSTRSRINDVDTAKKRAIFGTSSLVNLKSAMLQTPSNVQNIAYLLSFCVYYLYTDTYSTRINRCKQIIYIYI